MKYYTKTPEIINRFVEEYEFLSNFYPAKVYYNGSIFFNSEAAYQAQKCKDKSMQSLFEKLSADEAKRLGGKVECRDDWDEVKLPIMKEIVRAKFIQNKRLADFLTATGEILLLEGNHWKDYFWGVDIKTGEGENNLGKILMELREDFKKNGIKEDNSTNLYSLKHISHNIWLADFDITNIKCDCIVNATNKTLQAGSGVDRAIHRAAGERLKVSCEILGVCSVGEAKITPGFNLFAKYIIHTVGPKYPCEDCEKKLYASYYNSLLLANENGAASIAFPVISTGKFSYPKNEACEIAVKAVSDWRSKHDPGNKVKIIFACVEHNLYRVMEKAIDHYGEVMP